MVEPVANRLHRYLVPAIGEPNLDAALTVTLVLSPNPNGDSDHAKMDLKFQCINTHYRQPLGTMVTAEVPTRYMQLLTPVLVAFLPRAVTNALVPVLGHTLTHSPLQVSESRFGCHGIVLA